MGIVYKTSMESLGFFITTDTAYQRPAREREKNRNTRGGWLKMLNYSG